MQAGAAYQLAYERALRILDPVFRGMLYTSRMSEVFMRTYRLIAKTQSRIKQQAACRQAKLYVLESYWD